MTAVPNSVPTNPAPVGPPPPFDPEVAAALALFPAPMHGWTQAHLPTLRQGFPGLEPLSDEALARDGFFHVQKQSAPGPEGAPDVPLLICLPANAPSITACVFYIHGGGMILGAARDGLPQALDWAQDLNIAVVSVDYRLAPETPHPGPVEDCYAGLSWVAENAHILNIDASKIVVAGASAGGGLAAALALLARDRSGPAIHGQLLVCPMLDDRNDSQSSLQMAGVGVWDRTSNETGWTALLGSTRGADVSPYAAPARATDLSGLPPAFIDVGSAETFRDEDVAYASRIWAAGGVAELHVWPGGCHGFDEFAPTARISQEARKRRRVWLQRLLEN